jgi:hypothetical protein
MASGAITPAPSPLRGGVTALFQLLVDTQQCSWLEPEGAPRWNPRREDTNPGNDHHWDCKGWPGRRIEHRSRAADRSNDPTESECGRDP